MQYAKREAGSCQSIISRLGFPMGLEEDGR